MCFQRRLGSTIWFGFCCRITVDPDEGTGTNLVLKILLNVFISPRVQKETFQVSGGFNLSFWCLTAKERPPPLLGFYYFLPFKKVAIVDNLPERKKIMNLRLFSIPGIELSPESTFQGNCLLVGPVPAGNP